MESKFLELIESKYGKDITDILLKDNKLQTQNIKYKNSINQEIVKKHLIHLKNRLNLDFEISEDGRWAFDFPGWLGALQFSEQRTKKYMVIGLEPHIEQFDFQVTYGLSDNTPIDNVPRFNIDKSKKEFVQCRNDSSIIWTNLFKLLASYDTFIDVFEKESETSLYKFLSQFYITDLCHFAPQDRANAIFKIRDWPRIRSTVANEFLRQEIELINPELIITQGAEVFNRVTDVLKIQNIQNFNIDVGQQKWSLRVGNDKNTKVLRVPHIGSIMIHRTFWNKNLNAVKSILTTNEVLS